MVSTFVNPVVNPDRTLGLTAFNETTPIRRPLSAASDEVDDVIRAIYKQVLGNAYVMESERQPALDSQFRKGDISVAEFVRQLAKSELYRDRFFNNGPRNRFIELNFKHLLGRAPESTAEIAAHSAILDSQGYEAEIDSYLDSDEYTQAFGDDTVPYYRGYKTGSGNRLVGFTHIFPLLRGASSSDKQVAANNPARLMRQLFANQASSVISPSGAKSRQGGSATGSAEDILKNVFAQTRVAASGGDSPAPAASPFAGMDDAALASTASTQSEQISALKAQLAQLSSLSTMGAAMLRKGQLPQAAEAAPVFGSAGPSSLVQTVTDQSAEIETLRGELMSARSLANIAEFKLNKWRQRSY
ncbi:MAG: phycobilisome rod-core linker polypeptide [Cyanobacteria bacterium P01_A01_bin.116]